ncbi:MAG: 3-phosphoshikimate 1-carboxyvinyltransferase [Cyclobacteriaceae bacterium]
MRSIISKFDKNLQGVVKLTSSKSESNRALLINALSGNKMTLENLSAARDTQTMMRLFRERGDVWDVLDAGTTMRFCTAYLGVNGKGETITGTPRMKERPIGLLADALIRLGAEVEYLEKQGYPPLRIQGIKVQKTKKIQIPGNVSSQFISALLMIGPVLPEGLELELTTEIFSRPYIEMTLALMNHFGVQSDWQENTITIKPQSYKEQAYTIESDWSGASYWFSLAALDAQPDLVLTGLKEDSLQGDQQIVNIMQEMGLSTQYSDGGVRLSKGNTSNKSVQIDFKTCPDLAQTVMVTAAIKAIPLEMTGLESLKIKETDRIAAMTNELKKIGALLTEDGSTWTLTPGTIPDKIAPIETYEDHRMAMAFAPVCQIRPVEILDPEVVNKSYPAFWDDLRSVGVEIK